MTPRQKLFAIAMALVLLAFILEMIRRRRLREEFALIWLVVGAGGMVLVVGYDVILVPLTHAIGAIVPTTTLFLFGLLFLAVLGVTFSIHISTLTTQVTELTRELALVRDELESGSNAPSDASDTDTQ